ncbi:MAG: [citrate (pro-3S)-lyase] ligase [Selenomonas sp.]|nr:[citrate (pro-3S)-lyase] ligase [Selenomonas sp.]
MYEVSTIYASDQQGMAQVEKLLAQEGLQRDKNLDYSCGIFNDQGELIATGSAFHNSLRCFAVSREHQGEGLLNTIVTHLLEVEQSRGYFSLYLCTKPQSAAFFGTLGFYEIARVGEKLVFMENDAQGLTRYLQQLQQETAAVFPDHKWPASAAAIVLNANPLTKGHLHLIHTAAANTPLLHIFLVREDLSFFPYADRRQIVTAAIKDLPNVILHDTGSYLISSATFPGYFLKESSLISRTHAALDCQLFARIAAALQIKHRYVGAEPFSEVTALYNTALQQELPPLGINLHVIPRKKQDGVPISASQVRQLLQSPQPFQEDLWKKLTALLPTASLNFLKTAAAQPILEKLVQAQEVVHH